jgi:hypothetical protein
MRRVAGEAKVIHAWSPQAARVARRLGALCGANVVFSLPHLPPKGNLAPLLRALRRPAYVVTVPTRAARASLLASGAAAERVYVLPAPAADIPDGEARRRQAREALGLARHDVALIAPSEMTRWAGHRYACWVHAIVRQVRADLRLLLPGRGPFEQRVRYFAPTTGYPGEVIFTENRFDRQELLAASDIAGFFFERDSGVAAVTAAMAAGLPIVGSHTADMAEVAPHAEAALLTPPRDPRAASAALLELLGDPERSRRLRRAASERYQAHFTPAVCRRKLHELYASLIESRA